MSRDLIIEAGQSDRHYWREIWRYRELFYILAWRDISVRYRQTVVGVAWALIQPLLTVLILTVIFGTLADLKGKVDAPYAIFVLAGMLPWQFFSTALMSSSQSLVGNASLISKVYFPRMIIPAGAVVTSFVDFLVSFTILVAMMVWYQHWPTWRIVTLPIFVLVAFLASMGPGLLVTALNVRYRDFRYVVPFLVQFGLYASPVGFGVAIFREKFGDTGVLLYSLNPMVAVIDGFRWAILGSDIRLEWSGFLVSGLVIAGFLVVGVRYFRHTERTFADVI